GGRHRKSPTGGAAYGTPRYAATPSLTTPHTGPFSVVTSVPSEHAGTACAPTASGARTGHEAKPAAVSAEMATTRVRDVTRGSLVRTISPWNARRWSSSWIVSVAARHC